MEIDRIKIRYLIAKKKINVSKLSELSGLSRSAISKVINGQTPSPRPATIGMIAEALDVELEEILKED